MEKYLRGLEENLYNQELNLIKSTSPSRPESGFDGNNNAEYYTTETNVKNGSVPQLSKWLESAANFQPSKNNYIEWCARNRAAENSMSEDCQLQLAIHQKDEIEAAEALTKLALNFRSRHAR